MSNAAELEETIAKLKGRIDEAQSLIWKAQRQLSNLEEDFEKTYDSFSCASKEDRSLYESRSEFYGALDGLNDRIDDFREDLADYEASEA